MKPRSKSKHKSASKPELESEKGEKVRQKDVDSAQWCELTSGFQNQAVLEHTSCNRIQEAKVTENVRVRTMGVARHLHRDATNPT